MSARKTPRMAPGPKKYMLRVEMVDCTNTHISGIVARLTLLVRQPGVLRMPEPAQRGKDCAPFGGTTAHSSSGRRCAPQMCSRGPDVPPELIAKSSGRGRRSPTRARTHLAATHLVAKTHVAGGHGAAGAHWAATVHKVAGAHVPPEPSWEPCAHNRWGCRSPRVAGAT